MRCEFISKATLPIKPEEAEEARSKHLKSYRLNNARKFSRKACVCGL